MSNIYYTQINMYVTGSDPSTPNTGSMNYYTKTSGGEIHTFIQDDIGNVRRSSLPGGTTSYTLRYDGTNWISNDTLKISTTEVTINDNGSSTIDFRIEGDTLDHLIFLDSSADSIGINNSTPNANTCLDIAGSKPMKFNTMSSTAISLVAASNGMVTVNSNLSKGVIRLQNGISSEWRYFDNPLNHTGKGTRTENANYNIQSTDYIIYVDTSGGNVSVFLPTSPVNEQTFIIKISKMGNNLTLDGNGKDIEQAGIPTMTTATQDPYVVSYNSNADLWFLIS